MPNAAKRDREGREQPPIGDYAVIGDCRTSALVSRGGSLDWLCLGQPDSPSLFAGILDAERGGSWRVRPRAIRSLSRRYLDDALVLETTYECDGGRVRLVDLMQVCPEKVRTGEVLPDHEIARRVECLEGEVTVDVDLRPRPDYGRGRVRVRGGGGPGFSFEAGPRSFLFRSEIPLSIDDDRAGLSGSIRMTEGDRRWMTIGHTMRGPGVFPMLGEAAEKRLERSLDWWRKWSGGCRLPSVRPEMVARSAIVLKSLVYPPSGAVVAAPTTSLPEEIGGERNWDYRYCWIRDASLTMRAMLNLGVHDEAHSFFSWLLYATRLTWPRLQVLYDVHGRTRVKEREIGSLAGYRGSRPVRIGNGARTQRQLDVYGALLDAAWQYHEAEGQLSRVAGKMLRGFVQTARDGWRKPDAGIWESRGGPQHHTLSKAMCWVAMERGLRLARDGVLELDTERIEREMEEVARTVREEGWSDSRGSYVATLGGGSLDASLLLLSVYGFEEPDSDRMLSTIDRIDEELGEARGTIRRYVDRDDGVSGSEGAFGICGFWGVEALAMSGQRERARERFDRLLETANDVGLFSEEFDPEHQRALGNFPQALTHIGLINAACQLDEEHARPGTPRPERKVG